MKIWQKVGIAAGGVLVLGGIAWYSIYKSNQDVVTVQSGRVVREDLTSLVTASGEIRPQNYTNVLGEGIGKITDIVVNEGDHVKKGPCCFTWKTSSQGRTFRPSRRASTQPSQR